MARYAEDAAHMPFGIGGRPIGIGPLGAATIPDCTRDFARFGCLDPHATRFGDAAFGRGKGEFYERAADQLIGRMIDAVGLERDIARVKRAAFVLAQLYATAVDLVKQDVLIAAVMVRAGARLENDLAHRADREGDDLERDLGTIGRHVLALARPRGLHRAVAHPAEHRLPRQRAARNVQCVGDGGIAIACVGHVSYSLEAFCAVSTARKGRMASSATSPPPSPRQPCNAQKAGGVIVA